MFFMRMRNHAKWLFVLLAIVFVFSFVVAGVGSGSGAGSLFDSVPLFGGGGNGDALKKAQKAVDKAGDNTAQLAPALHDLGKAQVAKAKYSDAEATYLRYLALRPTDMDARRELATAYKNEADVAGGQLRGVEADVVQSAPTNLNGPLDQDAIGTAVHADAVSTATDLYDQFAKPKRKELKALAAAVAKAPADEKENFLSLMSSEAYSSAVEGYYFATYVGESPDATAARADTAVWAKDATTALQALLKLHPKDSTTAQIKQRISDMKQIAGLSGQ